MFQRQEIGDNCRVPSVNDKCERRDCFVVQDSTSAPDRRQMRLRCRGAWNLGEWVKDSPVIALSRDIVVRVAVRRRQPHVGIR